MRVAVTGASGHIGSCLVRTLKEKGAEIKVLVHKQRSDLDKLGLEITEGDLLDIGSLDKLCNGAEAVFHLAAQITLDNRSDKKTYDVNVTGTRNILNAAKRRGVRKFIHFSSIHAFSPVPEDILLDETMPAIDTGGSIYEVTKAEGEKEVINAAREGLDAVILNPTAVIGPFDYRRSALGEALIKIYGNRLPFLISGGYNWVDVRDVVSAAINAVDYGRKGEKYILSGEYRTLRELSEMISNISGCRIPVITPVFLARMTCPFFRIYSSVTGREPLYTNQTLDILVNSPVKISNAKARRELKYKPRLLADTLKDTFSWYDEHKMLR